MTRSIRYVWIGSITWVVGLCAQAGTLTEAPSPEAKAVHYLVQETPRWKPENKCYSCHNNGDAVRALYRAKKLGMPVSEKATEDTTAWLTRPDSWDKNGGEGPFNDRVLARVQFAAALADAVAMGQTNDRKALLRAAELIAEHQQREGFWKISPDGTIGGPTTYGNALATVMAMRTLEQADARHYHKSIQAARTWLLTTKVNTVLDAAAVLLAIDSKSAPQQFEHCLNLIRKGEAKTGGWGPYVNSPSEAFDTAVVVLALVRHRDRKELVEMIERGRRYLIAMQNPDGSWPETTRPAGGEGYSQRVSTSGWAAQALLATQTRP